MASSETLSGSLSTNDSSDIRGVTRRYYNVSIWGTFVATVKLQRSFDDGVTWLTCKTTTVPFEGFGVETEAQIQYRYEVTNWVSGTINYRLGLSKF